MIVDRKKLKKTVIFCTVLLFAVVLACSLGGMQNTDDSSSNVESGNAGHEISEIYNNAIKVSVAVGEGYEISDEDELETTLTTQFISTDDTVAVLRSGKYIMGLRRGQAYITVNSNDGETVYDVTVTANEDIPQMSRLQTAGDIPENDVCLGKGYNALCGEELNVISMDDSQPILDWGKLYGNGKIGMAAINSTKSYNYSGTSMNSFLESYSKKSTVEVSAKLFGKEIYKKRKEFSFFDENSKYSVSSLNQAYIQIQKSYYYIEEDEDEYENYLLPEVKEKLMGTDRAHTTPEAFIKEYGTHVLVSGIYGGSFEYNYSYSDSEYSVLNTINPHSGIGRYIGQYTDLGLKGYKQTVYEGIYEKHFKRKAMKKPELLGECLFKILTDNFKGRLGKIDSAEKLGVETSSLYIGGFAIYSWNRGDTVENTIDHMVEWRDDLDDELIGPKDKWSLYPVWDLIPDDTPEGKARKAEFVKYIQSLQ